MGNENFLMVDAAICINVLTEGLPIEVPQVHVVISQPRSQEIQARCPEIIMSIAVAAEGPLNFLLSVLDICP